MRAAISAVLVAILVGACSSSAIPAPSSPGVEAPPPTVTASQTLAASLMPSAPAAPMTVAAAAKRYLVLAGAYNAAIDAAFKKYVANGQWLSLGAFRACYKTTATLDRRFADNLRKTIWPAACAADVKLLLRQVAANEAADLRASTARDWTDATTLDTLAGKASAVAQDTANLVRADLGLPSVPVIRP